VQRLVPSVRVLGAERPGRGPIRDAGQGQNETPADRRAPVGCGCVESSSGMLNKKQTTTSPRLMLLFSGLSSLLRGLIKIEQGGLLTGEQWGA